MQKSVNNSNLYYFKDKGSVKITSRLEALGGTLIWSNQLNFDKSGFFTSTSGPFAVLIKNWSKKMYSGEFLQSTILDKSRWDLTAIFVFSCHFSAPS